MRVTGLSTLAPQLTTNYEDWEVLLELSKLGSVDGFITNDAAMLQQATEMVALSRTRLTLVVTDGVGHDAMRATGLVMVHLRQIASQVGQSRIFVLRPSALRPDTPGQQINKIASNLRTPPNQLISAELPKILARLR